MDADEDHIANLMRFLACYQWIYDFQITRFFVDPVWEHIPPEWESYLLSLSLEEINGLPFGLHVKDDCPQSLKSFIDEALTFSSWRQRSRPEYSNSEQVSIDAELRRGMTPKKQHEVTNMAALVHRLATEVKCDVIVDVGSGLGYLGQILHKQFGHHIIGLESKQSHTSGAERRKFKGDKSTSIHNVTFELQSDSDCMENFKQLICDIHSVLLATTHQDVVTDSQTRDQRESGAVEHTGSCGQCPGGASKYIRPHKQTKDPDTKFSSSIGTVESVSDIMPGNMKIKIPSEKCDDMADIARLEFSKLQNDRPYNAVTDSKICGIGTSYKNSGTDSEISFQVKSNKTRCEIDSVPSTGKSELLGCGESNQSECFSDVKTSKSKDCNQSDCSSYVKTGKSEDGNQIEVDVTQIKDKDLKFNKSSHYCENIPSQSNDTENSNLSNQLNDNMNTEKDQSDEILQPCVGPEPRVLMIGLHCCGDLTPTMMEYFTKLDIIKGLCCVSCCYHRMKHNDSYQSFDNFPLSACMKKAYSKIKGSYPKWNLNIFSMRLAAQETRARWKNQSPYDHDVHTCNVGYRGILELFIHIESLKHEKFFRKVVNKTDFTSFNSYIDASCYRTSLSTTAEEISSVKERLLRLYEEYQSKFKYIEPITALQVMLQPVLEGMIHVDRLLWLQEMGFHAELIPIFDEFISPRNIALVASNLSL